MPASKPSIGKATASGIIWTTFLNIGGRGVALISQLILARILLPEDFGVVGLTYTISTLFTVLTNFGIDQVFQQRHPRMRLWVTQAFSISLGLAVLVALAMAVYAPIGARIYHNDKITALVWIMAAGLPLAALSTVPQAQLRSAMRFKFLAIYNSGELLASQILTVIFALTGLGAISFVLPTPIVSLVRALVFWRIAPLPLRSLRLSKGWRHMVTRGTTVFGITLLTTCIGQGDYVTLGLLTSAHVVGIYYFAFKFSAQPMILLASSFTGVLRPALVVMNDDKARQCDAALRTAEILGLLTVPVSFLQAAVADPGLRLLFGERWLEAIPLIQFLSLGLALDAPSWAAGSLLESRGLFGKSLKYQLITAPLFFILVGSGALWNGATGVAIGVTIYYTIHPIYLTLLVFGREKVGYGRILGCFAKPVLMSAATIGSAYALSRLPLLRDHLLAQIAVIALIGGPAYLLAIRHFVPHIHAELWKRLLPGRQQPLGKEA